MDEPEPKSQESENLVAEGLHAQRRQYSSHFFSHGDTLASVAMRHKMELSDLMKAPPSHPFTIIFFFNFLVSAVAYEGTTLASIYNYIFFLIFLFQPWLMIILRWSVLQINRLNKWSHVRTGQILYVRASPSLERAQQQRGTTPRQYTGGRNCCADAWPNHRPPALCACVAHVAHHLPEDTETKGDGATDIMVDSSERRCVPLLLFIDGRHTAERSSDLFVVRARVRAGACVRPGATAWTRGGLLPHAPHSGGARSSTFPRAPVSQSFFFFFFITIIIIFFYDPLMTLTRSWHTRVSCCSRCKKTTNVQTSWNQSFSSTPNVSRAA
jgi:hypothetical protein